MHWPLLICAGLIVFWLRDVFAAIDAGRLRKPAAGAAAVLSLLIFTALGVAAERISRAEAYQLLADPRFWSPAVAIHAVLGLATQRLRQKSPQLAWLVAMMPAPVFVFSAGGACWLLLNRVGGLEGWQAGLLAGAAWAGSVQIAASLFRPISIKNALDFASASNLTAIILIPLNQQAEETSAPSAPLDWTTTLLPLGLAALLILASFAIHRYRSNRHATDS
jgi:predicted transporter